MILKIDPKELVVVQDEYLDPVDIQDIQDSLPDATPRYVIISYELKHQDGRISYPIVGLYYNPEGFKFNFSH